MQIRLGKYKQTVVNRSHVVRGELLYRDQQSVIPLVLTFKDEL